MSGGITNPPVFQSGTVTPRHFAVWTTDGVIQDAGDPVAPFPTGGIGIQSSNATSINITNGPITGPYSGLSFGITPTAANITLQNFNGAPQLQLHFFINGVDIPFPGPGGPFMSIGGGTFTGPVILNADPVVALGAATKQYVDAGDAALSATINAGTAGALFGMTLANDGVTPNTVLDIAAGSCSDSTNTVKIVLGAFTKSIAGTWVAGTANNGMGVGLTATLNTWYHVFAIIVSGVADVYFDTSVTAANKPVGTTSFRRIGSIRLDASVHITPFVQNGDRFDLSGPVQEFLGTPGVVTAVTLTFSSVPPGVVVAVAMTGFLGDSVVGSGMYLSALAQADLGVGTGATALVSVAGANVNSWYITVVTNTLAQIRRRMSTTTANCAINVIGYVDTRGRT